MRVRHKVHGMTGVALKRSFARVSVVWDRPITSTNWPLMRNLVFRVPCGTRRLA